MDSCNVIDHDDQFDAEPHPMARLRANGMVCWKLRSGVQPEDRAFAADGDIAARSLAQNFEAKNIPIEGG